jgi:uncharacterized repeat protein (TIGR03837 family)
VKKRWDIFCKIVDNFGDIGVCWRLARQLQTEHGLQVRLWVDDLSAAQKIIPNLNIETKQQICEAITINKWDEAADFTTTAEVVIEAFACGLPEQYLTAMQGQKSKWINLEYLSAEAWVDEFHGKPSPQANGLIRYFYFPGFTEAAGGLIREANIAELTQNHSNSSFPRKREPILAGNSRWIPAFAGMTEYEGLNDVLKISLFCYPNAPIKALFNALQANIHAASVYVPASSILPEIADFFGEETIGVGDYLSRGNLHVHILPFLSQTDYDKLLGDCDINFVRGEDSWVRAIWSGKPFIWQPYLQTENTHIKKLKAFIDVFYANCEQKEVLWKAHEYWAAEHVLQADFNLNWQNYMNALQSTQTYTKTQSQKLAAQTDLATKLVIFCNNI